MNEPSTDGVIRLADRLDALRIIPRALVIGYGLFLAWYASYLGTWVMNYDFASLQSEVVALAIVAFPTGILGVMAGVFGKMCDNYFRTGRSNGG